MSDFIKYIENVLQEQGKTVNILFENNIVSKDTFYKYRKRFPNLSTLINIVNFLEVDIDYLFEISENNDFRPYKLNQNKFYENLTSLLKSYDISQRQFCRDLNYARANLMRWKRGINPRTETLLEIMKYLNVSSSDLLERE